MKTTINAKSSIIVAIIIIVFGIILFTIGMFADSLFANTKTIVYEKENLTETQKHNKFFTEERIKDELYYLSAWEYIENMTDDEYEKTFFNEV